MSHQTVPAGNAVQWITSAFNLIMKNPGVFLLITLVMAILFVIPILNIVTQVILGPAFMGGLMYAYREQENGRVAKFEHLFQAFQQPGKIGPMIMLCLPGVVAAVLCAIILGITIGGAFMAAMMGGGEPSLSGMGLGIGAIVAVLLCMAIGLIVAMCMYFATPRVMFDDVEPFTALKQSFNAALSNIGALLLLLVMIFVIGIVGMVLMIVPFLGMVIWMLGLLALGGAINFYAYKDVFGDPNGAGQDALPPAQPPVMPM